MIATAKEGGLRVYDLADEEIQSIPATPAPRADGVDGRYNNVDIAYGLELGGRTVDVAVVSDRFNDQLRSWVIDPAGADAETPLTEVTAPEQEDVGVWRIQLLGSRRPVLIDRVADFSIHDVFDEESEECVPVGEDDTGFGGPRGVGVDDINGSDGLAVTNRPVGRYRQGLLVSHDEPESGPGVDQDRDPTNFFLVDWGDVANALRLQVSTNSRNDPRFR